MSRVASFADDLLWEMLALSPDLAVELGVRELDGRALPQDRVPDYSDAACAERRNVIDRCGRALPALAEAAQTQDDRTTWRVLDYLTREGGFGLYSGRAARAWPDIPYPVDHLGGWHVSAESMLARDSVVESRDDAEAWLARLDGLPQAVEGVLEALAARRAEGVLAPRSTLAMSLAQLQGRLAESPDRTLLVAALRKKASAAIGDEEGAGFARRAEAIWRDAVAPAYARLAAATAAELENSDGDCGFWALPEGEAWYAWHLRRQTTTDLTPGEVHQIGLEEVAKVQAQIRDEFQALGIGQGSIPELYAAISGPEQRAFTAAADDRNAALAETAALVARLEATAASLFARLPAAGVEVELIAPDQEDSQHSRYTPPDRSGGRPGRFSLNLKSQSDRPQWELPVLCAHEATPGHHTQLALAQELPLCAFRRTVVFTAYIEGWAKYAETLLDSELMDDPLVRLGRLRGELYSSVNLALDTGVHAQRWTRDRAIRFFRTETGAGAPMAEAIVDRCLVWPGQLAAYKIGMLKMRELRDSFTGPVQAFHSAVLDQGALPLTVLDDALRRGAQA